MNQFLLWTGIAVATAAAVGVGLRGFVLVRGHYIIITGRILLLAGAMVSMPTILEVMMPSYGRGITILPATIVGGILIVGIAFIQAAKNLKDGDVKRGSICTAFQLAILVTALLIGLVPLKFMEALAAVGAMTR